MTTALGVAGGIGLLCFYSPAFWIGAIVSSPIWHSTPLSEICRSELPSPGFRPPYLFERWINSEVWFFIYQADSKCTDELSLTTEANKELNRKKLERAANESAIQALQASMESGKAELSTVCDKLMTFGTVWATVCHFPISLLCTRNEG